jgi:hypothetical protein
MDEVWLTELGETQLTEIWLKDIVLFEDWRKHLSRNWESA